MVTATNPCYLIFFTQGACPALDKDESFVDQEVPRSDFVLTRCDLIVFSSSRREVASASNDCRSKYNLLKFILLIGLLLLETHDVFLKHSHVFSVLIILRSQSINVFFLLHNNVLHGSNHLFNTTILARHFLALGPWPSRWRGASIRLLSCTRRRHSTRCY